MNKTKEKYQREVYEESQKKNYDAREIENRKEKKRKKDVGDKGKDKGDLGRREKYERGRRYL